MALSATSNWRQACLDEPDAAARRPGYRLSSAQREAVRTYLVSLVPDKNSDEIVSPPIEGRQVLLERNCLACHARGLSEGIAAQTGALIAAHPELATLAAALAPPALRA